MEPLTLEEVLEETRTPGWPECFKTCRNFCNDLGSGKKDYFMDWAKGKPDLSKPRCVIGLKADNMQSWLINNRWHNTMKCYIE